MLPTEKEEVLTVTYSSVGDVVMCNGVHCHNDYERATERSPLLPGLSTVKCRPADASTSTSTDEADDGSNDSRGSGLRSLTRSQIIILAMTAVSDLLVFLSISIMAPFFPEEALAKGVSDTLSGWIFGTSPFVQFLVAPFIGKLMPHTGLKFMYLAGVFLFSGCTILFGLLEYVPTDNGSGVFITLAFCLQAVRSVGSASTSTASFTLLLTHFPDNVSMAFGFCEVFVGLGLVSGPGLGGLLYGAGGFVLPFFTIGALALLCLPVIACVAPFPKHGSISKDVKQSQGSYTQIVCNANGIIISLTIISSTVMWSILDPTLEPFLRKFHLSPEIVGVLFLVMAAVYAASSPLWGWLSDKITDKRPLPIIGFMTACCGSLLIGPSPLLGLDANYSELWLVILSLVILGASSSLCSVPTFDMFLMTAQEQGLEDNTMTYSLVAGVWMSMYSLGDFIGPSVGGFLLDTVGFPEMTTFSAGLSLLMAIILALQYACDHGRCCRCCKNIQLKEVFSYHTFDNSECTRLPT
ncbi:MFS-type transporter SLC18B1-like isoform X2 [Mya arenaria]|uniref:MFS-type transporter SLC18B1-like isoform X2 n=1 Tax=Mya arenaria TaxID=6604 RepID=UPI0022E24213|nr:MFS-type transporter SLC18B1-like isoform X2 [Mya arenaria]